MLTNRLFAHLPLPGIQRQQLALAVRDLEPPARRILVLRSRIGRTARALARICPDAEVIGIDPSSSRVRLAKKRSERAGLQLEYVDGELESLPWKAGRFDLVVVMLGLHELPDAQRARVLDEGYRVLAPRGHFFAVEPERPESPLLGLLADLWFRYREEAGAIALLRGGLVKELRERGFSVLRKRVSGAGFFQLVCAEKMG